jgi:CheY-like chemotaxis protein
MDPKTRARIFEPFFTTKERGKGTGLGLATVYGIIRQSGGTISVDTEVGRGTSFGIYLPRTDAPAQPIRRSRPSGVAMGRETVLVVEDEPPVRRLAERILRTAGYRVLAAPNGEAALALARGLEHGIDLLLTDVVMPQMSGRELQERLVERFPRMRVLYMSGYAADTVVQHGVRESAVHFVAKPFSATDLTHKVREALDAQLPQAGVSPSP